MYIRLGTSLAFYRGQKGPSPENSESLKRGSRGLSALGSTKREKKSKKSRKRVKNPKRTWKIVIEFFRPRGRAGGVISEIAKPRVRKPRVFINCYPDPPPKPPIPPPKTCPCRSLLGTMHSYTFPHKEVRVFRDGVLGVGRGGGDLWKPGVSGFQAQGFAISDNSQEAPQYLPKVVQGKCPLHFLLLMGPFARTLFSRRLLPWPILCYSRQILHAKVLEHIVWSNTSGFQFRGPLARINFCRHFVGFPNSPSFPSPKSF